MQTPNLPMNPSQEQKHQRGNRTLTKKEMKK
jgi:hypothetical protein